MNAPRDEVEICGTIYGSYDYGSEGQGAWVGHAILALGGQAPITATFVDRDNTGERIGGGTRGTETISFCFPNGDTLELFAVFVRTPASAPGLNMLHGTGRIAHATGVFRGLSGYMIFDGPFLMPDASVTSGTPLWIAEIHGLLFGSR